ncbi:MAG TPA: hypothetical protein VHW05_08150 [Phenylobacterium sp.]|jgi:hypothetical protein|nr:hypothetical protein [Phenylobacterium sp.]
MRHLAPILTALLLLAACGAQPDSGAILAARQRAIDPPTLWLLQDLGPAGQVRAATLVCADTPMHRTFLRTRAEIEGAECRDLAPPVAIPHGVTERCVADGRRYAFATQTLGDPTADFRLTVSVTPLGGEAGPGAVTRHYRRLGPCPPTWQVGDQTAAPAAMR